MAEFKDTMLTKQGRSLLAKAMAGTLLRFTRMQAGAGLPDGGVDGMTALIAPRLEGEIFSVSSAGNGGCFIKGRFSNTGLSQSFRMCEIGVFAEDPEVGEILYCYTSVQDVDKADFMGADTGNPGGLLEEEITIGAYISNASNVTANITRSAWASEIGYDNSESGLNSTELQGAIDALACSHVIEIPIIHGLDCHPKVVAIETAYGFGMKGFGSSGFGGELEHQEIKCRGIYLNRNSMKVAMEKKYEGTPTLQRISDGEFVFRFPNIALIVSLISDYATMNRAIQGISALLAAQASGLNTEINSLNTDLIALQSTVTYNKTSCDSSINNLNAELAALSGAVTSNKAEASTVLSALDAKITEKVNAVPRGFGK